MSIPDEVIVHEVGPRDGLQNEEETVPTPKKIAFIDRLSDTGLERVEATSFVAPDQVPQLADAEDVMNGISRKENVSYPVLVPNQTGLERAKSVGVEQIAVFTAASETFCERNINCSITESLERFEDVIQRARSYGMGVRGYVSCIAGCPYEGDVETRHVVNVTVALREMGCDEVSLGDTIGVGTPEQIRSIIRRVKQYVSVDQLALHCHDTYGQALANIYAAMQEGVRVIDSAAGGLGGCPFAKSAAGNVATEDLLYMLNGMGVDTGVSMDRILEAASFIIETLDRSASSRLMNVDSRDAPGGCE
jgi:isopropylmalate/homocitrate/citramalate synthase